MFSGLERQNSTSEINILAAVVSGEGSSCRTEDFLLCSLMGLCSSWVHRQAQAQEDRERWAGKEEERKTGRGRAI